MRIKVQSTDETGIATSVMLDQFPDNCPICSSNGQPTFVASCMHSSIRSLYATFRCPVTKCRGQYVGFYKLSKSSVGTWEADITKTSLARHTKENVFQKNISDISRLFCEIFNQALLAEENGLNHICGPGYRKALEFLIKDFLVSHKFKDEPAKQEEIKKTFLGKVIQELIDDQRVKQCAQRAVWLGNDETHYVRKWEGKDLDDLKSLIHLTVNFIDSSIEADRYMADMAEGK